MLSKIMEFLADNWEIGCAVCSVLVVAGYLTYSIMLMKSCRKVGYDVGTSCMIPIWNLLITPIKKHFVIRKNRKMALEEEILL